MGVEAQHGGPLVAGSIRGMTPMTPHDTDFLYNSPYACTRAHGRDLEGNRCHPVSSVSSVSSNGPRPIAEALERIASRLRNLGPDHRDPELFHLQKSELVHELRRLARAAL